MEKVEEVVAAAMVGMAGMVGMMSIVGIAVAVAVVAVVAVVVMVSAGMAGGWTVGADPCVSLCCPPPPHTQIRRQHDLHVAEPRPTPPV